MGEFEFIEAIRRSFEGIGDGNITGIGDDCAVLPLAGGESLVVTADMLVEGVHFLRHATSARELGAKSLAVSLSDVAAMGARPVASFLSISLPAECRGGWAEEFMEGYRELSARYAVRLAGGDTTGSAGEASMSGGASIAGEASAADGKADSVAGGNTTGPEAGFSASGGIAINVTVIGRAPNSRLKYRSGARPGDMVVVNAPLGESAAGLQDILRGRTDTRFAHIHRNPDPQVYQGAWLGEREEVHSMMDLSDGLASDLVHILKASGVGAEIDLDAVPAPLRRKCANEGVAVPPEERHTGAHAGLTASFEECPVSTTPAVEPGPGRAMELHEPVANRAAEPDGFVPEPDVELAVTGGEDYKLLFTVAPEKFARLAEAYRSHFGSELHPVGRIAAGPPRIVWLENGSPVERNWRGFVHF